MLDKAENAVWFENAHDFLRYRRLIAQVNVVVHAGCGDQVKAAISKGNLQRRFLPANLQPRAVLEHAVGYIATDHLGEVVLTKTKQVALATTEVQPTGLKRVTAKMLPELAQQKPFPFEEEARVRSESVANGIVEQPE